METLPTHPSTDSSAKNSPIATSSSSSPIDENTQPWLKPLPNAIHLGQVGLYLPTHAYLEETDVKYIVALVKCYFELAESIGDSNVTGNSAVLESDNLVAKCGIATLTPPRLHGWVDEKRREAYVFHQNHEKPKGNRCCYRLLGWGEVGSMNL